MLDYVMQQTSFYIENMPKNERKKYGQFFTSKETAIYMAASFDRVLDRSSLSVLDAGAGTGILSAALMDRLSNEDVESVNLTCYETDEKILGILKSNLQYIKENVRFEFDFKIITENYITSQAADFTNTLDCNRNPKKYDLVIGNPPYMKINKHSSEALAMPSVCYGAPNLYFLFASMSLFNLKNNGEMVYIIPRSWTSGAYFEAFREYFLFDGKLENMHLFVSRDKVFDKENVLQETIIIKVRKTKIKPEFVTITSSQSNHDFEKIQSIKVPYDIAISGKRHYVYLVTSQYEVNLLKRLGQWNLNLLDIGLKMKTGLTVDFREREYLQEGPGERTIPMFFAQHIKQGKIVYPVGKYGEYLLPDKKGLIQKNSNYLFVKRFTSKEENRRLQCAIYLARQFPTFDYISTQNKINFIDNSQHNLSESMVYGLYALFNSTIYDQYYRILNGSTQVNSTEVNTMPVPSLEMINEIGIKLMASVDLSEKNCNRILEAFLDGEKGRSERIS